MATTQIADIVVPQEFTNYVVENSMVSTALYKSGAVVRNGEMVAQLHAGSDSFTVPFWRDLGETDPNIGTDNPADVAVPLKITAGSQKVRKSFLNQSWSAADLAAELSGDDPLKALQGRISAYWDRVMERRLVATLKGILASNVANNSGDMVHDISGASGAAANFSAEAVIDTVSTLGDALDSVKAIAMHSAVYTSAMKNDLIEFIPQSQGAPIKVFRGLAVVVDDNLTPATGVYTTILMGSGSIAYGVAQPRVAPGTEIDRAPAQGNGAGVTTLHSRINAALQPLGFSFTGSSVVSESPTTAELATAANWTRVATSRKSIPLAFLISKIG